MSSEITSPNPNSGGSLDFIRQIIVDDVKNNKNDGRVHTRFPPEPNGYLHIGHAKSICLNFGIAKQFNGKCNLRMDDTNPAKEDVEYVEAIKRDVKWLGFDWEDRLYYASDYYQFLYECAIKLIKMGKAYVDSLNADQVREYRGTLTQPGKESPYRNRSVKENLELFERMKKGEFEEGIHILRAKIDMASPNITMRDPALYRILKQEPHYRTGDKWCIYPMYDFAHCLSDSLEGITHSICTLEFENNRPLYDWILDQLNMKCHPQQIEFARLNLTYTVMSKRKLIKLVKEKHVNGWDDPRMPTIAGIRRRGYTPEAMRNFADVIGISKRENLIDVELLEFCVREDLNKTAPRIMGVLKPLKLVIDNYPDKQVEEIEVPFMQDNPAMGSRKIPFAKVLYIEQDDFMENPPKDFYRLAPGRTTRLRYAYFITCTKVVKDQNGNITEVHCTYDPNSKNALTHEGKKPKAIIHWIAADHCIKAEARLYERLLMVKDLSEVTDNDFLKHINPKSLEVTTCYVEKSMKNAKAGERYQFERLAYFSVDPDTTKNLLVFNRIVSLKDAWAKLQQKQKSGE